MSQRTTFALAAAVLGVGVAIASAQQPQTPSFKAATELVQLDVSVLDKDHKPVRGLTQQDFTVLEDGKPQGIVAFTPVEIPEAVAPTAAWMRTTSPDVGTNSLTERRIFALVMDDATFRGDLFVLRAAKASAKTFVDHLGPMDLAAVIFTSDNRAAVDFTSDHNRLNAAIDTFHPGDMKAKPRDISQRTILSPSVLMDVCLYSRYAVNTLKRLTDYLISLPLHRKGIVYVSTGPAVDFSAKDPCEEAAIADTKQMFRNAQQANVNVYSVDPNGVGGGDFTDYLHTIADNTGGRWIGGTNDPAAQVPTILTENSSYYLIGYTPTNVKDDGTFRRLEVKVDRKDVEVHTRHFYYAPVSETAKAATKPLPVETKAIAELLPNTDIALGATAIPFAGPDAKSASVAVVLRVDRPSLGAGRSDDLTVTTNIFDPEGRPRGSNTEVAHVALSPGSGPTLSYEVLSQLVLPPGRYALRIAAKSASLDKVGSVYAEVTVPDFANEVVSLSGVAVSAAPSLTFAPPHALGSLLPIVPTSLRVFDRGYRASAFFDIYEGAKARLAPVTLRTRLLGDHDVSIVDTTDTIDVAAFDAKTHSAEHRFELPLPRLTPGPYVLLFDATLGKTTVQRAVQFMMR